mmetsp:Transcript_8622/g.21192  ORF Transcript_8622/g.21192 Transcript_8622/m.21192 type:complete len:209 (-) Transcript_8622:1236-1862(-)
MNGQIVGAVGLVQFGLDALDTLFHLNLIRIAGLDVGFRNPVCRKENVHGRQTRSFLGGLFLFFLGKTIELGRNQVGHGLDVSRSIVPAGDHRVHHVAIGGRLFGKVLLQDPQGTPGGGNTELGIEGKNDECLDFVSANRLQGFFRIGFPVPHSDIGFDGHAILFLKGFRQQFGLCVGVFQNGEPPPMLSYAARLLGALRLAMKPAITF